MLYLQMVLLHTYLDIGEGAARLNQWMKSAEESNQTGGSKKCQ